MAKHEKIGVFSRIKGWFASLASICAGVVLYMGIEDIAEEIPYHRELGLAFIAFGAVFILALLFHGTEFGFRLQCLLLIVFACFFGGLTVIGTGPTIYGAWRLASQGQPAQAVVLASHRHQYKKNTTWTHTIRYANRTARVEIAGRPRRGSTLSVLYLGDDPGVVLAGSRGDSFLELLDKSIGRWWGLTAIAFTVVMAIFALVKLKQFLVGRGEPLVEAAERESG